MEFGVGRTSFWTLPNSKKNGEEVIRLLKAIPHIQSIFLVSLSKPIKPVEVEELRKILNRFSIDTTAITTKQFEVYLESILEEKDIYCIDFKNEPYNGKHIKIFIKPIEQHPDFSPECLLHSLRTKEDIAEREYTVDDFEIEIETFEEYVTDIKDEDGSDSDFNNQQS